jgi:hypothetical protein
LRTFIEGRTYALIGLLAVIGCGICLYVWPQTWMWALLTPVFLWGLRLSIKKNLEMHPLIILGLSLFVITAAIGYWAAYDETAAWQKLCLIVAAVLFYLVLTDQPPENIKILAGFWFIVGVGVVSYFLLTFDFSTQTKKFQLLHMLGLAWMNIRPGLQLPSIHPNDTAGIAIITAAYGMYFFGRDRNTGYFPKLVTVVGSGIVLLGLIMTSSRGAFIAITGALGILLIWRLLLRLRSPLKERLVSIFPSAVVIGILLLGIAEFLLPLGILGSSFYIGDGVVISRSELIRSGLWILHDFPFTGGGLSSFPGLYSQYVLVIPYYSILNSHNMFLDVAVEQGIAGGISFSLIYLIAAWQLLTALRDDHSAQMRWLLYAASISLFTAIFHGMVDDYIYGGRGTILAFAPVGMALLVSRITYRTQLVKKVVAQQVHQRSWDFSARTFIWIIPVILLAAVFWKPIAAQWYANLGAVKLAKLDLVNYPANRWPEEKDPQQWRPAEADLQQALSYEADNQTANHRIGLMRLVSRNFEPATQYLLKAYDKDPVNRGIVKNLGYSYLWHGELDQAQAVLLRIPETKYELDIYVWWWDVHDRHDLAKNAFDLASRFND